MFPRRYPSNPLPASFSPPPNSPLSPSGIQKTPEKIGSGSQSLNGDRRRALQSLHSPQTPNKAGNSNPYKTPSPAKTLDVETSAFLKNNLARLRGLVLFLNQELGDNWAFSGSVALEIHAENKSMSMPRIPNDVDVVLNADAMRILERKLTGPDALNGIRLQRPELNAGPPYFQFNQFLKVDLLVSQRQGYGTLDQMVRINGVPVLSIDALVESKNRSLKVARDEQWPSLIDKAKSDIDFLHQLKQREQMTLFTAKKLPRAALANRLSAMTGEKLAPATTSPKKIKRKLPF